MKISRKPQMGRKTLPLGEKKEHVQLFIKQKDVQRFGGLEQLKDILTSFAELAEIDGKSGKITFRTSKDEFSTVR